MSVQMVDILNTFVNKLMQTICIFTCFYRASYATTVLAVTVCLYIRLSVCPSIRHKSELYKDG